MKDIFQRLSAPFPPDRVSWRIGSTTKDKTRGMALAYIDARDVMERLDNVVGPALLEGPQKWPYYDRVKTAVLLDEELENDTEREITYARVLMEVAINCKNHGKGTIDETILNDVLDQAKQYWHVIY